VKRMSTSLVGAACRAAVCGVVAACSGGDVTSQTGLMCVPQIAPYALIVSVTDSITGRPIALRTTGIADAPAVHDTLVLYSPGDSLRLHSLRDEQGRYRITLDQPGYHTWIAYGVNVMWGACSGGNVQVAARLQPIAP
jgi:hypothetical protein